MRGVAAVFGIAFLAAVCVTQSATAQDVGAECDRLAADPDDPRATPPGIAIGDIDGVRAVAACEVALAAFPDNPTYLHQAGRAQFALGDPEGALLLFAAAADRGYAAAAMSAATMLQLGVGVTQDLPRANQYYRIAADAGMVPALERLGEAYHHGLGVTADIATAVGFYERAVQGGSRQAALALGYVALYGEAPGLTLEDARDNFLVALLDEEDLSFEDWAAAMYGLARAFLGLGEPPELVLDITDELLLALDTPMDGPQRALVLAVAAEAEMQRGGFVSATARLLEAVDLEPEHPYLADRLGDAYAGLNLWAEAVAAWNDAISLYTLTPELTVPGWDPGLIAGKIAAAPAR